MIIFKYIISILLLITVIFPVQLSAQPGNWSDPVNISNTPGGSILPDMAIGAEEYIHVVWSDDSRLENVWMDDILYTYFDGYIWAEPEQISAYDTTYSYNPRIAMDSQGYPHVVWNHRSIFPDADIYYTTLTDSGWLEPVNLTAETGTAYRPVIGIDSQDNIHVIWSNYNAGQTDIFYRKFNGIEWSPIDTAIITPYYSANIDMQIDSQDNIHIVWRDNAYTAEDIFYSKYDGESWSSPQNISQISALTSDYPSLAIDTSDNPHVVWRQSLGGQFSEIYYNFFDGDNWNEAEDISNLGIRSYLPELFITNQNIQVLLFAVESQFGDPFLNYMYRINSLWTYPDTINGNYPGGMSAIAIDYHDLIHVCFSTGIGGSSNIAYTNNSQFCSIQTEQSNVSVDKFLLSCYPNPFNNSTSISFDLADACYVELLVYDVTGREVAKLVNGFQAAGAYEVAFGGNDLSSGIYFAQMQAGKYNKTVKLFLIK